MSDTPEPPDEDEPGGPVEPVEDGPAEPDQTEQPDTAPEDC